MNLRFYSLSLLLLALACSEPPKFEGRNKLGADDGSEIGNGNQTPKTSDKEPTGGDESPNLPDPSDEMKPDPTQEIPKDKEMEKEKEKEKEPEVPLPPPYDPCPKAGEPCVIMPLGDSITYGFSGYDTGGYRVPLVKKAWAANKKITFVGNEQTGPAKVDGKDFPRMNEGHSGWTIDDISGREGISKIIVASLNKFKPSIVLLQIGTNDTDLNADVANAPTRLGNLIDTIAKTSPDTLIVVAQIVPSRKADGEMRVMNFNAKIPELVKVRADAGKHVIVADMHGAFVANAAWKTTYFQDDLHPNNNGMDVMANVWWDLTSKYFK